MRRKSMAGYGVRAFLIAQSLNQIEKAYGEHNSILDNCHVRVAFATNDERTARRISDTRPSGWRVFCSHDSWATASASGLERIEATLTISAR